MEKYHNRHPPLPSLPWSPNYCIWVPCHPTVAFSPRPPKDWWTPSQALVQSSRVLSWCVPLRAARLGAHSGFIQTRRGNCWEKDDDAAATFRSKTTRCLYQWQKNSVRSGTAAESSSLVAVTGDVYARRYSRSGWPTTPVHGCAEQHLWWFAPHPEPSLGARSALPQRTSARGSPREWRDGSAAPNSSVVHYRWVSLRLVHVCDAARQRQLKCTAPRKIGQI